MLTLVAQVGVQELTDSEGTAPEGNPAVDKLIDWAVPETNAAEMLLETDCAWATDLLPPFESEKSKDEDDVPTGSNSILSARITCVLV